MKSKLSAPFGAALGLACAWPMQAKADQIFTDNFDTGMLAGWTVTTNVPSGQQSGILASTDTSVSPSYSLKSHAIVTTDGVHPLNNLFVDANHTFTTNNGTYSF